MTVFNEKMDDLRQQLIDAYAKELIKVRQENLELQKDYLELSCDSF